ncbi:ABC transporter ATP-binding protein [Desulfurivibrio alkaliphilus]|uniref:ABC transporter related protein n=1 Tax=Desulfurivibrio alkaliphilus (strain DSM 19089 / UNIQEM U267 / AHT2) TaxID=589865 RepID=D6Z378_DESAT|nr:ABC transporter ATP-binding protein [Desulfurivibrio alkaliphilus]ADH86003.1 ABC transporter related protein [Desulfurivibrio alkaliphilus AHT 2]
MTDKAVPLVELRKVGKSFPDPKPLTILQGVDLTIGAGETMAVVGSSGSGKTTLLHLLGALDRPSSGQVLYQGEDLFSRPADRLAHFRNRQIGFVFQFHHLLPEFSARENIMLPGFIAGEQPRAVERRAAELLEQIGLTARAEHRVGELSGGEQQRVAIARALIMEPKLLLADEPTGNLDPQTGEAIFELLCRLNRSLGLAMVMVTHNYQLAARLNRVLRLEDGALREIDPEQLAQLASIAP